MLKRSRASNISFNRAASNRGARRDETLTRLNKLEFYLADLRCTDPSDARIWHEAIFRVYSEGFSEEDIYREIGESKDSVEAWVNEESQPSCDTRALIQMVFASLVVEKIKLLGGIASYPVLEYA